MTDTIQMTAEIVAAYVEGNKIAAADLPSLISSVFGALNGTSSAPAEEAAPAVKATPSQIKKSIQPEYLVCLEDGRQFKSLKRHLRTKYNLSPDDYRAKWGLAKDYPMVAPAYSEARSALAKTMGLGQGGRVAKVAEPVKAKRSAGRPKKVPTAAAAE